MPCSLPPKPFRPPKPGHEFIYALLCPDTGKARYVGRTALSLQARLNLHHAQLKAIKQPNAALMAWKFQLLGNGKRPIIQLLQVVQRGAAGPAERKWTRHCQKAGGLLNVRNVLLADTVHGYDLWALNDIADHHRHDALGIGVATQVCIASIARFLSGSGVVSKNTADLVAKYLHSLPADYMPRLSGGESPYNPYYVF